ncbi:YneF family protein [Fundicoccus ignavus]|uniref:YneF family protein n=1 Tax=Fundicoccus ignavus TaxID=2664442 RepID=A0A6I2GAV2_9LACT|nr:YneF family protein [Fundicoccus ignavus]MRI80663.1 YneF family protein [Fundicoccus ignavus]MRI84897.1 YneF family protein [Fundicoccus ignavus]MRJ46460.1 YneF family protein [Fundicoccus ignavus]
MPTIAWIFIVLLALVAGAVGGFFLARRYMMKYFKENPPIDERMITQMMAQMGQKPSKKKVEQIMRSMKGQ